ncbi:hypothetical protein BC938DRAFT_483859 [Jimgerdemannia flammicorona]|uniref:EF-hand domain-containing protein n=1 Tax=Jimgerdemannia flammicorona TaxID=994334 RepID=A0A433QB05_9FUNG|nr:hypothetical protein BC938DRAFT_483859 [Jimgerdemannia flammicorona]
MFKAYFYLSMELVRDVVKAMEDDMMDSFEFQASQPVSSAFTAAIPQPPVDDTREPHTRGDDDADAVDDANRFPQKENYFRELARTEGGVESSSSSSSSSWTPAPAAAAAGVLSSSASSVPAQRRRSSSTALASSSSIIPHRRIPAIDTHPRSLTASPASPSSSAPTPSTVSSPYLPAVGSGGVLSLYPDPPRKPWEEKFPIMESMSQDAIEEMVEKTFKSIETKREGFISYEEFRVFVQTDSSIVSWFEALGTVF